MLKKITIKRANLLVKKKGKKHLSWNCIIFGFWSFLSTLFWCCIHFSREDRFYSSSGHAYDHNRIIQNCFVGNLCFAKTHVFFFALKRDALEFSYFLFVKKTHIVILLSLFWTIILSEVDMTIKICYIFLDFISFL